MDTFKLDGTSLVSLSKVSERERGVEMFFQLSNMFMIKRANCEEKLIYLYLRFRLRITAITKKMTMKKKES